MQLPQIRMESQFAQIGMRQSVGKQELHQPKAELSIEQPKAELSIQTSRAQLTIDQTKAFEDANLMSIIKRMEIFAQEGKSAILEGMQRKAQQGSELMKIENGGNSIANQAVVNGHDQMKTLGLTYIPSQFSVTTHYEPGHIQIEAQANQPNIDVQINQVEHHYDRGSVEVFMERYEQLEIDYTNIYSATV